MVKGISKRVIMVKTPINSMFEQAIFILKEDSSSSGSVKAKDIIREANTIANDYVRTHCNKRRRLPEKWAITSIISSAFTLLLCSLTYIFFL